MYAFQGRMKPPLEIAYEAIELERAVLGESVGCQDQTFAAMGVNAREWFFTLGQYDVVLTVEAPDDETLTKAVLVLATQGNLRTVTLRGFGEKEMEAIVGAIP